MSGGPKRRFPRTARAMPEPPPTIEREKIRHRRPNDLIFDEAERPPTRRGLLTDDLDDRGHAAGQETYDDGESDWTEGDDGALKASAWDEEPEDDWVLRGEDDEHSGSDLFDDDVRGDDRRDAHADDGYVEIYEEDEESGVVWEEDAAVESDFVEDPGFAESSDEIAFDQQQERFGFAPEVELAGRRDVRPKPPRPAQSRQAAAARRPARPQRTDAQPRSRRQEGAWAPGDDPDETVVQPRREPPGARHRPPETDAMPLDDPPEPTGRFSRTRATLGTSAAGAEAQVLERPRRAPPKRRNQAKGMPPPANMPKRDRYGAIRSGRGRMKGLIAAVLLILIAAGGWYVYRSIGADGIGPVVERVTTLIPWPGASRTAADTAFGEDDANENEAAAQALSELEERVRQQTGGDVSDDPIDPATVAIVGPPIPALKPLPGATPSLPPDAATGEAQLAATDGASGVDDEGGEPSIFEQLWQFLRPG